MYRIVVCDDEKEEREEIGSLTGEIMNTEGAACEIEYVSSPAELLRARERGHKWNLILLDILMDGPSGLKLAQTLREGGDDTDLVFVTSCAEYALEGYRSYPVNYLVKPLTKETLAPVLRHCLEGWRKEPLLLLRTEENAEIRIPLKEICYIEVFRRELLVHCDRRCITGTGALNALLEQLPSARFYRSHRSYVVNLQWVEGIRRYEFLMKNGEKVPVAIRNYGEAQQKWLDYFY